MADDDFGLGRVPFMHPKAAAWPIAPLLAEPPPKTREHPWPKTAFEIHQHESGTCTGASLLAIIGGLPIKWSVPALAEYLKVDEPGISDPTGKLIAALYRRFVASDVWPDNDYESGLITCPTLEDLQWGSSVDAAMMTGLRLGFWREVRWCKNAAELSQWLRRVDGSPAQIGINWYDEWFNPPADGVIREMGRELAGGHALKVRWNYTRKGGGLWLIDNSWGRSWGLQGSIYMADSVFQEVVFNQGGECAVAVERAITV